MLIFSVLPGSASRIASYPRSNGIRRMATEASLSTPKAGSSTSKNVQILASTILNRSPILTRTIHPFEEAYYAYQRRLYRALSQTLPADVYFKPGSLVQRRVAIEELAREKEAFGEDWEPVRGLRVEEDDVAGGEGEGTGGMGAKSFVQQMADEAELEEKPQPRVHRADVEGDVKSLDRLGERNLYLVVKQNSVWTFPTGSAETEQVPLHKVRSAN
jgi:large subunit ribosomal protein L46